MNRLALARAFVAGTVAALVIDIVLQAALAAVTVTGPGAGASPWAALNLQPRGRWVLFALLLVAAASAFANDADGTQSSADAWRTVGRACIGIPLLWLAATLGVTAVGLAVAGEWSALGQVFLSAPYYHAVIAGYAPWLLAGAVLIGASRHV